MTWPAPVRPPTTKRSTKSRPEVDDQTEARPDLMAGGRNFPAPSVTITGLPRLVLTPSSASIALGRRKEMLVEDRNDVVPEDFPCVRVVLK